MSEHEGELIRTEYVPVPTSVLPIVVTALVACAVGFVGGQFVRLPWVSEVCETPVGLLGICAVICVAACALQSFWLSRTSNWLLWLNRELSANRSSNTESGGASE